MTTKVPDAMLVDGPNFSTANVLVPIDGATVTITPDCNYYRLLVTPAANLSALTLSPLVGTLAGQTIEIAFGKNITTLTWGANVLTAPFTLPATITATVAAPVKVTLAWYPPSSKWLKV